MKAALNDLRTEPLGGTTGDRRCPFVWVALIALVACAVLASSLFGWFFASSFVAGVALSVLNLWILRGLVGRTLSARSTSLSPVLGIVAKLFGLAAIVLGLSLAGLASPFPLAVGFAIVSFVAPLVVRVAP